MRIFCFLSWHNWEMIFSSKQSEYSDIFVVYKKCKCCGKEMSYTLCERGRLEEISSEWLKLKHPNIELKRHKEEKVT